VAETNTPVGGLPQANVGRGAGSAGPAKLGGEVIGPGVLAYLGRGRDELALDMLGGSRALLLGGRPFAEDLLM
jgi:quercetin 2,3-dioxygenase